MDEATERSRVRVRAGERESSTGHGGFWNVGGAARWRTETVGEHRQRCPDVVDAEPGEDEYPSHRALLEDHLPNAHEDDHCGRAMKSKQWTNGNTHQNQQFIPWGGRHRGSERGGAGGGRRRSDAFLFIVFFLQVSPTPERTVDEPVWCSASVPRA